MASGNGTEAALSVDSEDFHGNPLCIDCLGGGYELGIIGRHTCAACGGDGLSQGYREWMRAASQVRLEIEKLISRNLGAGPTQP